MIWRQALRLLTSNFPSDLFHRRYPEGPRFHQRAEGSERVLCGLAVRAQLLARLKNAALRDDGIRCLAFDFWNESVAYATHRQQMLGLGRIAFDVAAQAYDEIIDGAGVGILVQTPDVFEDRFARNNATAICTR